MSNLCLLSTSDFPISFPCQIFQFVYVSNLFVSFSCQISPSLFHVKALSFFLVKSPCLFSMSLFQFNILSIFSSQIYPFLVHVKSPSLLSISNLSLFLEGSPSMSSKNMTWLLNYVSRKSVRNVSDGFKIFTISSLK